jgi:hypothetical protein
MALRAPLLEPRLAIAHDRLRERDSGRHRRDLGLAGVRHTPGSNPTSLGAARPFRVHHDEFARIRAVSADDGGRPAFAGLLWTFVAGRDRLFRPWASLIRKRSQVRVLDRPLTGIQDFAAFVQLSGFWLCVDRRALGGPWGHHGATSYYRQAGKRSWFRAGVQVGAGCENAVRCVSSVPEGTGRRALERSARRLAARRSDIDHPADAQRRRLGDRGPRRDGLAIAVWSVRARRHSGPEGPGGAAGSGGRAGGLVGLTSRARCPKPRPDSVGGRSLVPQHESRRGRAPGARSLGEDVGSQATDRHPRR